MSEAELVRTVVRLEQKIDDMSAAIVSLARIEERTVTLFNRLDRADLEIRDLRGRVLDLERQAMGRGFSSVGLTVAGLRSSGPWLGRSLGGFSRNTSDFRRAVGIWNGPALPGFFMG
ncbi:hypothetical protein QWZ10_02650 [Paracoccus cavernae]|uniref:DUF1515 domain-containing protein n=1 Tax=Paracoccus cavernae TaxID=1571207 RepID=A0ABT8D6F1_9RHOB|nr:hypothetical protein [Paracoccus cavernae]